MLCSYFFRCLRTSDVKDKAMELFQQCGYSNEVFNASNGWFERFKVRNSISSRRITGHSQKIPKELPLLAETFWSNIDAVGRFLTNIYIAVLY